LDGSADRSESIGDVSVCISFLMSTQILTKLKKGGLNLESLFIVLTKELYFKKVCTLKRSVDAHTMVAIVAVFYADLGPYLIFT